MENNNKGHQISIEAINEDQFSSRPLPESSERYVVGENLHIAIGYSFAIELKSNVFIYKMILKYFTADENKPELEYAFDTIFKVSDLAQLAKQIKDDEYNIDDDFIKTLTGVCVGTMRGLVASKTQGSEWKKYPLPIINVAELLKSSEK